MQHSFSEYLICRNNYLDNPQRVIELSSRQTYRKAEYYPGRRTENLLNLQDPDTKQFSVDFADRLGYDVFPGIRNYSMSLFFHINEAASDPVLDQGWVHKDVSVLAGMVYLTLGENNFESGTSIFTGEGVETTENKKVWNDYNLTGIATEEYVSLVKYNHSQFKETIKVGNMFNRLVAYDSKLYHKPNRYSTAVGSPRLSLLFFISQFDYSN
jgi:hypothetical protein